MSETKNKNYRALLDYDGKFMTLKIPTELHKSIKKDAIDRDDKNLDQLVLEYLKLGYDAHHNGYKGEPNA